MFHSATCPIFSALGPALLLSLLLSVFPDVISQLVSWEIFFKAFHLLSVGGNLDYG